MMDSGSYGGSASAISQFRKGRVQGMKLKRETAVGSALLRRQRTREFWGPRSKQPGNPTARPMWLALPGPDKRKLAPLKKTPVLAG